MELMIQDGQPACSKFVLDKRRSEIGSVGAGLEAACTRSTCICCRCPNRSTDLRS